MGYVGLEIYYRLVLRKRLLRSHGFYHLYAYTDTLTPGVFDKLLGTQTEISSVGFFKENRDFLLTAFGYEAEVVRQTRFRTNNCGLLSPRDYVVERGPNEFRIVIIGDEQTAGTTAEICWPDLLENELNDDRHFVEQVGCKAFRVFNLGWPDAGLTHFAEMATVNARHFDPNLVIVNLTAHSYERFRQGLPSTLHGKPYQGTPIAYSVGDRPEDTAWLLALCTCEQATLRSYHCTALPPFTFYMSPALIQQRDKVWQLMQRVVVDYIDGVILYDWRPFVLLRLLSARFDPLAGRKIETPHPSLMRDRELCDNTIVQLKRIAGAYHNVLITRNVTGHPDLFPIPTDDAVTQMIREADPSVNIIMMKQRMIGNHSSEELRSWYLADDLSKWSPKGHTVYARAMAELVHEWFAGRRVT